MDELAPGIRAEVIEHGYSHADGILAAVARGEARRAALTDLLVTPTMEPGIAAACPQPKEDL